tara:strand:+ start:8458 stop:9849 length:1392 start_codon:yes stop_codon:yes gene_type:complete
MTDPQLIVTGIPVHEKFLASFKAAMAHSEDAGAAMTPESALHAAFELPTSQQTQAHSADIAAALAAHSDTERPPVFLHDPQAPWSLPALLEAGIQVRVAAGYLPPWKALDLFMASSPEQTSPSDLLEYWCEYHERLLQWRQEHGVDCLLFRFDLISESWPDWLVAVERLAGATVTTEAQAPLPEHQECGPRAELYASLLDQVCPRATDIFRALEACADLFGKEPVFQIPVPDPKMGLQTLLSEWSTSAGSSKRTSALQAQILQLTAERDQQAADLKKQLSASDRNLKLQKQELQRLREDSERLTEELSNTDTSSAASDSQLVGDMQSRMDAVSSRCELLELQLGQVQDELEISFQRGVEQTALLDQAVVLACRARATIDQLREPEAQTSHSADDSARAYRLEAVELAARATALKAESEELKALVGDYEKQLRRAIDLVDRQDDALKRERLKKNQLAQQMDATP